MDLAGAVTLPTLVLAGGASPLLSAAARALAAALPDGRARILEGQGHDLDPEALGPLLAAFLSPAP